MESSSGPALNRLVQKAVICRPGVLPLAALLFTAFLFISCATTNPYIAVDADVDREEFAQAAGVLDTKKKVIYRNKDTVLYCLDKGMLNHYAGKYEESSASLEEGERAIEENFAVSISQEIGTVMVNERSREYDGEDYEDVYLNVFNALNYYHQGKMEEALVEIRRMNNKLRNLSVKYGTMISSVQKAALENNVEVPKSQGENIKFENSALARYLGMLFYRSGGDMDDARIDRDQLKLAFAAAPRIYTQPIPASINGELEIPAGMARLNVLAFAGRTPSKTEEIIRIPLGSNWIKISLPVMLSRPSAITSIVVEFDSGENFTLELLEDMGAVASATFERKKDVIYARSILRATVKGVSAAVLSSMADGSEDKNDAALFSILSLGTQIFAEASEQADLRVSRYFPGKAYVGALNVKPGAYSFSVHYYAGSRVTASRRFEDVPVLQNVLNLMEVVCLK
jgi:hypothetical protein